MFYGTSFNAYDLPWPRHSHHEWTLLHEESPKNVYLFSNANIMQMFNHSATFKRESDLPLTTVWLKSIEQIESKEYVCNLCKS